MPCCGMRKLLQRELVASKMVCERRLIRKSQRGFPAAAVAVVGAGAGLGQGQIVGSAVSRIYAVMA